MDKKNRKLKTKSFFNSLLGKRSDFAVPEGYRLVHSDNFEKIDYGYWKEYDHSGFFKTSDLKVWWDSESAMEVKDNTLSMWVEKKKRMWKISELPDWQRRELNYHETSSYALTSVYSACNKPYRKATNQEDYIEIPYVCGWLYSKEKYSSGIFKIDFKFPKGRRLWPSFWLSGVESWPPEIDVFEGYTQTNRIEPNVHYGDCDANHKATGPSRITMFAKSRKWHEAVCWWEGDFIRIYYDGNLVYEITDEDVLRWFRGKSQSVVLNCNIDYSKPWQIEDEPTKSKLMFRNFRIYQK